MRITHLTASTFFGGPERQMLGLAHALSAPYQTSFVSFSEGGRCGAFLREVAHAGFEALALAHDTPRLGRATRELTAALRDLETDILCCHGYKANFVGRAAARRLGVPAVAVSRGWTGETLRVRLYETLDRVHLRWMDHVVCVSQAQAARVERAGVPRTQITVVPNAIDVKRFAEPRTENRALLTALFARPPAFLVGAAGRLSPEKGFDVLIDAARDFRDADVGFALFGDGALRRSLERRIQEADLGGRFVLAGFRDDLDALLPALDAFVLPSFTEGLPNVVLEACAAGVPVIATAVGGTPEVIAHDVTGLLVPPGDAAALTEAVREMVETPSRRHALASAGRACVAAGFAFPAQARQYARLFERLGNCRPAVLEEAPC
jgi:glycosyltransferase involved in cell wall biosynthesis